MMTRLVHAALIVLAGAIVLGLLGDATPALAQCAMCRGALEQNAEAARGFNRAILFLLATPYAVFATIAGSWLLRRRNARATSRNRATLVAADLDAAR